ncbi:MAG: GNAT family N-acetyltransferase [Chlorobiaceae bacterium]|jgi:GNAT superfamily N-acetyltransferase|nr:GNAT family N-acetyltransferase [Chlorobiaceae bacterium]
MPVIRMAESGDIDSCARLLELLFSQEHEFIPDLRKQKAGLEMIIGNPTAGVVLVCEAEGRVAGMLTLLPLVSTALGRKVLLLEDMIVDPQWRGHGIGTQLVGYAQTWAQDHGYARITLLTDGDNVAAHRFYEANGFTRSSMNVFRKLSEP